jgi:hypothetical protein
MKPRIEEEAATLNMNPWVVAWARAIQIDPAAIARSTLDEPFMVESVRWTIPYCEWSSAKWREWREVCGQGWPKSCPYSHQFKLCDACYNNEAFSAWLFAQVECAQRDGDV